MKNKPDSELLDDENPEWTEAMFSEAKTAAELFPAKLVNHETALLSEQALAKDWLKPDEEAAWAYLQSEKL
jgi:hypothetical protein